MAERTGARARRTNPERSAKTRLKVLDGVVAALNEFGYGAVTTDVVCRSAAVTRGGLLHHFPSKAGLMAAAAEHCLDRMADERRTKREEGSLEADDVVMASLFEPYGVALTELIVASRSNDELKACFSPIIDGLMARQAQAAKGLSSRWGVEDRGGLTTMIYLHMAARRGLAMLALAGAPDEITSEALMLLRRYGQTTRGASKGDH